MQNNYNCWQINIRNKHYSTTNDYETLIAGLAQHSSNRQITRYIVQFQFVRSVLLTYCLIFECRFQMLLFPRCCLTRLRFICRIELFAPNKRWIKNVQNRFLSSQPVSVQNAWHSPFPSRYISALYQYRRCRDTFHHFTLSICTLECNGSVSSPPESNQLYTVTALIVLRNIHSHTTHICLKKTLLYLTST